MAEIATLARPYANAAFDLAKRLDRLDRWSRMLAILATATHTDEMQALIGSPALADEVKAHRLIEVASEHLDDLGRRFVHVLSANKRLHLLGEIASQFETRKAAAEQVVDVEITAAVALTATQIDAYSQALERRFEQVVHVNLAVDPGLVGGAVIRAGDTVIDGSLRGRLTRLNEALMHA